MTARAMSGVTVAALLLVAPWARARQVPAAPAPAAPGPTAPRTVPAEAEEPSVPHGEGAPPRSAPPLPAEPEPQVEAAPHARRYGDAGTSDAMILVGFGADGFTGGAGYGYFVGDGVAPGVEVIVHGGGGATSGMVMGTLRLVPLRTSMVALFLTGKAGRVLLSGHDDGWAAGGNAGLMLFLSRHVGLELGYEILRLLPASFCADLSACILSGPVVGLRAGF